MNAAVSPEHPEPRIEDYEPCLAPDAGYLIAQRGLPWKQYNPREHGPLWNWRELPRKVGMAATIVFLHIHDRTINEYGSPLWAEFTVQEFRQLTGQSDRHNRRAIQVLVAAGLVERDPEYFWRLGARPARIESAPLIDPRKTRKDKDRPRDRQASSRSGSLVSHLFQPDNSVQEQSQDNYVPEQQPDNRVPEQHREHSPDNCVPERSPDNRVQEQRGEQQLDKYVRVGDIPVPPQPIYVRDGDKFCPWNWSCPFLSSTLTSDKPLSLIKPLKPSVGQPLLQLQELRPTDADLSAIKELLQAELDHLPEEPRPELLLETWRNLHGDAGGSNFGPAPLENLRHHVRKRRHKFTSMGMARNLALEIGRVHQKAAQQRFTEAQAAAVSTFDRTKKRLSELIQETGILFQDLNRLAATG